MKHDLTIKVRKREHAAIFDLKGSIIGSWALALKEKIFDTKEKAIRNLVLNFRDVAFIDSLGVMVVAEALAGGLRIHAVHVPSCCHEMFQRHSVHLKIYSSEDNALEEFRIPPLEFSERRRSPRIKVDMPAEFTISRGVFRGILLDISEGGALLGYYDPLTEEDLRKGNLILNIKIPFIGLIQLAGRVVSSRDHLEMPAVGLRIFSPTSHFIN